MSEAADAEKILSEAVRKNSDSSLRREMLFDLAAAAGVPASTSDSAGTSTNDGSTGTSSDQPAPSTEARTPDGQVPELPAGWEAPPAFDRFDTDVEDPTVRWSSATWALLNRARARTSQRLSRTNGQCPRMSRHMKGSSSTAATNHRQNERPTGGTSSLTKRASTKFPDQNRVVSISNR